MQALTLSPEQREFRAVLRQFTEEKVAPGAARRDATGEYDWDVFKALVEMELPSLGIPEAYGGAGADLVTQAIAVEELARADASVSLMLLISKLGMLPVMNFGSEAMKQSYLPRIASGESQASSSTAMACVTRSAPAPPTPRGCRAMAAPSPRAP